MAGKGERPLLPSDGNPQIPKAKQASELPGGVH